MSEQSGENARAETNHTEWGVRWEDGATSSCGWIDGISEAFARRALMPDERVVVPPRGRAVAVVTRTRTVYADTVTEWTETNPPGMP